MFRRRIIQRNVLVNLLSGNAISGVCTYDTKHQLIIRGAMVHTSDAEPTPADGELLIDRANVDFIQIL